MDAIEMYKTTRKYYANGYASILDREEQATMQKFEDLVAAATDHEKEKPGVIQNLVSGGQLGKEWRERDEALHNACFACWHRIEILREMREKGEDHPKVQDYTRRVMESQHPEMVRSYREALQQKRFAEQRQIEWPSEQSRQGEVALSR